MPYPKDHKERTRGRILEEAGEAFREHGFDGVSVPAIMKRAGLTHGGFYAHFESKEALFAEACRTSLGFTSRTLAERASAAPRGERLDAVVTAYLSPDHRDHPERGCSIPALGPEISRQSQAVREAFTESFRTFIDTLGDLLPEGRPREDAYVLAAELVGAVVMARAVDDPQVGDEILAACRRDSIGRFAS